MMGRNQQQIMKNKEKGKQIFYTLLPGFSILLIFVVWMFFSGNGNELFPTPVEVLQRFVKTLTQPIAKATLLGHVWVSFRRVMIALLFSWTLGITIGVLLGSSKYFKAIFGSILEVFRPIPPIAWIPIIIMWFGIGELSKIILVFIGTFFPVMINTSAGISMVDQINMDVGVIFGGNRWQIMKEIIIPTALPSIFAGIRTSVSGGWTVVLAAEMMGAQQGLGALVMKGWNVADMSLVLTTVIAISLVGSLLAFALAKAERLVTPWNK